ncbi:hypothetical protein QYF36_013251 [Acer negundo]|nr:hypothetical protein QYF36_013251 [Acer negundo]
MVCNEALPSLVNLYNLKIITLPVSERCGLAVEDSAHALFWCSKAKEKRLFKLVWYGGCLVIPLPSRTLKLNSIVAVKESSPYIELWAVIQDSYGKVVAALAKPLVGDTMNVVSGILCNKFLNSVGLIIDDIRPYLQRLELLTVIPFLELGTWWHIL